MCAKFHQNWWSGFREKRAQDTEGHSFIIIRIVLDYSISNFTGKSENVLDFQIIVHGLCTKSPFVDVHLRAFLFSLSSSISAVVGLVHQRKLF